MTQSKSVMAFSALLLLVSSPLVLADTQVRALHIVVEFDAQQTWQSDTKEYGKEHSEATTHQRYELTTHLRSDNIPHSRNLLDRDLKTRLKAKTIHLASQAKRRLAAAGKPINIPHTEAEKSALAQRMQEDQFACHGDEVCRRGVMELYTALFAAAQYPNAGKKDTGKVNFLYFEPFSKCSNMTRVTMQMSIKGRHYNKGKHEVVPFTEQRSADSENTPEDVPLCEHYLAVIDTQDVAQPMYLENVYLPSAIGETVHTELGNTQRATESQPMNADVLGWVTQQLRHAPASGSVQGTVKLDTPLSGISEDSGGSEGTAQVKLTWSFLPPKTTEKGSSN